MMSSVADFPSASFFFSPENAFTAGTVELTASPATTVFTFANMAPGDEDYKEITVSNAGTLALRYAVTSVATNVDTKDLMGQITMTIKSGVTTCTGAVGFNADGAVIYDKGVLGSAGPDGAKVIGDPATGQQTGDRPLAASANEKLCVYVKLPLATADAFQGATTTATFNFAAEQTKNN